MRRRETTEGRSRARIITNDDPSIGSAMSFSGKVMTKITLRPNERATLERWAADQRNVLRSTRARAVLYAAQGNLAEADIAKLCDVSVKSVSNWIARFHADGLTALDRTTRV
jgi:hypothetical protein